MHSGTSSAKGINNDPNNLTWENAERFINKRLGLGSIIPLSAGEKGTLMTVFQKSVIDKNNRQGTYSICRLRRLNNCCLQVTLYQDWHWLDYIFAYRQRRTILCHRSRSRPFRNCRMVRQYRPVAHHQPTVPFAITAAGLSNFIVIHDKT